MVEPSCPKCGTTLVRASSHGAGEWWNCEHCEFSAYPEQLDRQMQKYLGEKKPGFHQAICPGCGATISDLAGTKAPCASCGYREGCC